MLPPDFLEHDCFGRSLERGGEIVFPLVSVRFVLSQSTVERRGFDSPILRGGEPGSLGLAAMLRAEMSDSEWHGAPFARELRQRLMESFQDRPDPTVATRTRLQWAIKDSNLRPHGCDPCALAS